MSLVDFRFAIELDGRMLGAFTECTLPTVEWDMEQIREGGLNGYVHQLPKGRKAGKMTLKRGIAYGLEILTWYKATLEDTFTRKEVTVHLYGYNHGKLSQVMSWTASQALPVKWSGPQLNVGGNSVVIETLELAFNEVSISFENSFF